MSSPKKIEEQAEQPSKTPLPPLVAVTRARPFSFAPEEEEDAEVQPPLKRLRTAAAPAAVLPDVRPTAYVPLAKRRAMREGQSVNTAASDVAACVPPVATTAPVVPAGKSTAPATTVPDTRVRERTWCEATDPNSSTAFAASFEPPAQTSVLKADTPLAHAAQRSLVEVYAELRAQRGGVVQTEEEKLAEEEAALLRHISAERAPLVAAREAAAAGTTNGGGGGGAAAAAGSTSAARVVTSHWQPTCEARNLTPAERAAVRAKWHIAAAGEDVPPPCVRFRYMRFPAALRSAMRARGMRRPTPIQVQGIPVALSGRDMIGIAFTGSGKTLVFTLPAVLIALDAEMRMPHRRGDGPVALILSPSRELAQQTYDWVCYWANALAGRLEASVKSGGGSSGGSSSASRTSVTGAPHGHSTARTTPAAPVAVQHFPHVRALLCMGGIEMRDQQEVMDHGVHIVVATPGRLLEQMRRGRISLAQCRYLCLDEADRMVANFEDDMRAVLDGFRGPRQTVLFSATMPTKIQEFALSALVRPVVVNVGRAGAASLDVIQEVEWVRNDDKLDYLLECLKKTSPPTLVFCANQAHADEVHEMLLRRGVSAAAAHGGKSQADRLLAVAEFRDGKRDVLVATDVASKGLDFPDIQHVINYDMPREMEDYVHRIGRTGRCGKTGVASSFVNRECSDSFLLDLKHLLLEAKQKVHPMLLKIHDPTDRARAAAASAAAAAAAATATAAGTVGTAAATEGTNACEYCGGLGHRISDCHKLANDTRSKRRGMGVESDLASGY